ncbi:hypothetical protein GW17_00039398 [Ensete ventricosum]|nr:hypothetical protein GW17_00039398 [Ensete ventricosum]
MVVGKSGYTRIVASQKYTTRLYTDRAACGGGAEIRLLSIPVGRSGCVCRPPSGRTTGNTRRSLLYKQVGHDHTANWPPGSAWVRRFYGVFLPRVPLWWDSTSVGAPSYGRQALDANRGGTRNDTALVRKSRKPRLCHRSVGFSVGNWPNPTLAPSRIMSEETNNIAILEASEKNLFVAQNVLPPAGDR